MDVITRNMLPVLERRRRPNYRDTVVDAAPGRALALVALAIIRRAGRSNGRPTAWSAPPFAREVDLVRLHLAPIRSRIGLAASFGREAFHGDLAEGARFGPVAAAYAIRWLEFGDGVRRPPWQDWLADGAESRSAAARIAS